MKSPTTRKRPGILLIWMALLIFAAVFYIAVAFWPPKSILNRSDRSIAEPSVDAASIHRLLADRISGMPETLLNELHELSLDHGNQIDQHGEAWLARHPQVLCATLWVNGRRWPNRLLAQNFWSRIDNLNLQDEAKRRLLGHLFESRRPNDIQAWQYMPLEEFGIPVVRIIRQSVTDKLILEIKIDARQWVTALAATVPAETSGAVIDGQNRILGSWGSENFVISQEYPYTAEGFSWTRENQPNTEWSSIVGVPLEITATETTFDIRPVLALFVALLFSILLARWLYARLFQPVVNLTDSITALAQGHFDTPLPPEKNPYLDHLVKIFNYMAGEMDRFQRINVHEIIHDKRKTETMLRNIADGVLVTDANDRIVIVNSAAEKWIGENQSVLNGKNIKNVLPNDALLDLIQEVKSTGQVQSAEFEIESHGGKIQTLKAHAAPLEVEDGKGLGVVTAMRDVTKEKETDEIKTALVSMVAHELKSPLTSIYGFSELLLESATLNTQEKEYAQVVLNESNRLTDLINKFLDLARLESGSTEIHKMPFDMGQLIHKVAEVHDSQAMKKKIRVITQVPANLPLAQGDQDMIEQVLVNLFSNAVKYSPSHSKIGIEVKEEGDNLAVSVIDNGYGIPKEALEHIFDKFYRVAENENLEEAEGSGLGLTLAKEIVEQHGGSIRVNSRLGVGSVFTIVIPKSDINTQNYNELLT